jgi:DNA mismatch endonuclease, patch repair protein
MDVVSPKRRSEIMSRIRGKDTTPELIVRKLVYSMGYRYRLHYSKLPGKPDLVFPGRKKVIFVHGCFWHGHEGCPKGSLPKTKLDYWRPKLEENKRRDAEKQEALKELGWQILIIWQCELKKIKLIKRSIMTFLDNNSVY